MSTPDYTCTITVLQAALAKAIDEADHVGSGVLKERLRFMWDLQAFINAYAKCQTEDEVYKLLMDRESDWTPVLPVAPEGFMFWTKRCGERHLMKLGLSPNDPGYGCTVCGRPCLGNNYAKERPEADPCPECHKP